MTERSPPDSPPPELLGNLQAQLEKIPSPSRPQLRRIRAMLALGCVVVASGIFFAFGGLRDDGGPRSARLIVATTLGAILIAAWALRLAAAERSIDAPRRAALLLVLVGTPVMLLTWKIGWSLSFEGAMAEWPDRVGIPCLQISLLVGVGGLFSLAWLRRRSELNHPALLGAAFGVVAGAFAWVVTDLWCPVGHVPHLLVGHLLPLLLLALAGTIIGSLWLGYRRVQASKTPDQ